MKLKVRKYRILEIMDARGIESIRDLGEQLNIAPTNISSLLNNKTNWNRKTLERLMEGLNCDLADVIEVELDKESDPQ
tara:strand:+ start:1743 stop:1976 length:234 start_codon:yes stop_codon:yes gene_type:complete